MKRKIKKGLVKNIKTWLRDEGIEHFRDIKEQYGRIDAVWNDGGIPHTVHFREGMQVRNHMRLNTHFCKDWDDHDYDDNWVELIEECIK